MNEERLRRLLLHAGETGRAESQARAWPVVKAAFAERDALTSARGREAGASLPPPRALRVRAIALVAAGIAALAIAVTPPGAAIADWLRETFSGKPGARNAAPALTHLPGGGRMLVNSRSGVWVVNADGSRRLLGPYDGATWSPRGLYVGVWRGHELLAVEPGGRVHWALARDARVRVARWSPDGFRIAYLAGGLRVVAGDGSGDRLLSARVAPVTPAWRPQAPHLIAFAPSRTSVRLVATDVGARVWTVPIGRAVRALAWTPDGRMLAVAARRSLLVLAGATGRVLRRVRLPSGTTIAAIAAAPAGHALAVVANTRASRGTAGRAQALTLDLAARRPEPRLVFTGAARFTRVEWSPDGRWIAIAWPAADQWLFVRSTRVTGVSAVRGIARQFDPAARAPRFAQLGAWCCAR